MKFSLLALALFTAAAAGMRRTAWGQMMPILLPSVEARQELPCDTVAVVPPHARIYHK